MSEKFRKADVLRKFPGLTREQLEYWDNRGWVKSSRLKLRRRNVRIYSPEEADKIGFIFSFVEKGYSPRKAYERYITRNRGEDLTSDRFSESETLLLERMREDYMSMPFPDFLRKYKFE